MYLAYLGMSTDPWNSSPEVAVLKKLFKHVYKGTVEMDIIDKGMIWYVVSNSICLR